MKERRAEVVKTYAFDGVKTVHGVTFDGQSVWFAYDDGGLLAFDPETGAERRRLERAGAEAGTAFDGTHLWKVSGRTIDKIDPGTGQVLSSIPTPDDHISGLAWADGVLWAGGYRSKTIRKIDPKTGAVLKTIRSDRFVTGVSWIDGELWHGTMEGGADAPESDVRRIDSETGAVAERIDLPKGVGCSGVEGDRSGRIWFGDTHVGKVRALRRV